MSDKSFRKILLLLVRCVPPGGNLPACAFLHYLIKIVNDLVIFLIWAPVHMGGKCQVGLFFLSFVFPDVTYLLLFFSSRKVF